MSVLTKDERAAIVASLGVMVGMSAAYEVNGNEKKAAQYDAYCSSLNELLKRDKGE